jgi:hypothetical protein
MTTWYEIHTINHPLEPYFGDIEHQSMDREEAEKYCKKRNKYYSKMRMNIRYYVKVVEKPTSYLFL